MNYVITGSLGHISQPIVTQLVAAGHQVSVISSQQENAGAIEALGAKPLIGSLEDGAFVQQSFAGADAVYLMIPPKWSVTDWLAYQRQVADNYVQAVQQHHIKTVVVLSSIGAHLREGAGPVDGLGYLEEKLTEAGVNTVFLRPSYFYYNLFAQADLVRNAGIFGGNFGGQEKLVLVDTDHIAQRAAHHLLATAPVQGQVIEYIANDECTTDEIARQLGAAIDKAGTPWVIFSDEQQYEGMIGAGLPPTIAKEYTTLGKALREGKMQEDYWQNKPEKMGELKLEQFAERFAHVFSQKKS